MTDVPDQPQDRSDKKEADDAPKKKLSGKAKVILLLIAAVALVALGIWFVHYEMRGKYVETTDDAFLQADTVTVAPKVTGYVDKVYVVDHQVVTAGQPLIRIDPRDLLAKRAQYEAQVASADANAESARGALKEQGAAIDQAAAQLGISQRDASFATAEAARYAPLAASGAETREKLAERTNEAGKAANNVVAQRAALAAARLHVDSLQAQLHQALAQGRTARAQLDAANVDLAATEVTASVSGRIGDKQVRLGQFVSAGTRLMSVVPATIYVTANFKETQIGLMRTGQPADVEIDAIPGVVFNGRVDSLSPGTGAQFSLLPPQNATGNFTKIVQRVPVRIALAAGPRTAQLLMPGMSVKVKVDTLGAKGDLDERRDADRAAQVGTR